MYSKEIECLTHILELWIQRGHTGNSSDTSNILFLEAGYLSYFIKKIIYVFIK